MSNIIKQANDFKLNPRYDMVLGEIRDLYGLSQNDLFNAFRISYKYGYLKGQRALKAEQKAKKKQKATV